MINPWASFKNIYQPHSLINVVSGWFCPGLLHDTHPQHLTLSFLCLVEFGKHYEKGMMCGVSRWHWAFNRWRSMVHLGCLFFFDVIIIGQHHWVGVPIGTGLIILHLTSLCRLRFMDSFQWYSTGVGTYVFLEQGSALGLWWICAAGVFISGKNTWIKSGIIELVK